MKPHYTQKIMVFSILLNLVLAGYSYYLIIENQKNFQIVVGHYVRSQHNLLDHLKNAMAAKETPQYFIDNLALAKAELKMIGNLNQEQITIPSSLISFSNQGESYINEAFVNALNGKPLEQNYERIEEYIAELSNVTDELRYSKVVNGKSKTGIYKALEVVASNHESRYDYNR